MTNDPVRATLSALFQKGVDAVTGEAAVTAWLKSHPMETPTHVFAAGKAALAMFRGLPKDWQSSVPSLIVTKTDHLGDAEFGDNVVALEASHPVPDQVSLLAGEKALSFVRQCGDDARLLVLVSGGASSLVEHLKEGIAYSELEALNKRALGDGSDIAEINRRRKQLSAIKDGLLFADYRGQSIVTLAISDVKGDGIDVIGSGLGSEPETKSYPFDYASHIVASNALARGAVVHAAGEAGYDVICNHETLYDDVTKAADMIAQEVRSGPAGLYVFGGEPTVVLPDDPGLGGRNQALALELAKRFRNVEGVTGMVAGTDGSDGPTQAAGGFFDASSFEAADGAQEALLRANSAAYLAGTGDQVVTGPTGTNVMDIAIVIKRG